jgi:hypothetical protein
MRLDLLGLRRGSIAFGDVDEQPKSYIEVQRIADGSVSGFTVDGSQFTVRNGYHP